MDFDFDKLVLVVTMALSMGLGFLAVVGALEHPASAAVWLAAAWMVWPSKRL